MRIHIKRLLLAGAGALALGACNPDAPPAATTSELMVVAPTATPAVAPAVYTVQRGEVADILTLEGRVAPTIDQDIFFAQDGNIKALYVKRDDSVKSGQLLAELDPGELTDQLSKVQADHQSALSALKASQSQRQLTVANARISLQAAQDNLTRVQSTPPVAYAEAQAALDKAKLQLDATHRSTSAAKTQATIALEQAANELRNRQDEYSQVVWANGNQPLEQLSPEQRDRQNQAKRAVENAEGNFNLAQAALAAAKQSEIDGIALAEQDLKLAQLRFEMQQAGPDPLDVAAAKRAVESAQLTVAIVQSSGGASDLTARVEETQRVVETIQKQIDALQIYAPFDGVVAEVSVKPGDHVTTYAPVINVMSPSKLELVVQDIAYEDLAKLNVGKPVEITFASTPDTIVPGAVSQLPADQTASESSVRANTSLRIGFDAGELALAIGDAATVKVVLRSEQSALWLPPSAIRSFDTRHFVVMKAGDRQQQVDITLGIIASERVQILSGVKEGDEVVGASAGR
jgi:HlyD family secretion protein